MSGRPKGAKNKYTILEENSIPIENLPEVMKVAKKEMAEKKNNPGVVLDGDAGLVFKDGEPYRIIGNKYVKNDEAMVILQTRKIVKEYLKLQELKDKLSRGMN